MALLDVSEVLFDPDFMDSSLVVTATTQTIGANGLAVNATIDQTFSGVVTNNNGDMLQRLADGERVTGNILIHTVYRLSAGKGYRAADVVTWRGQKYTVKGIVDYTNFGRGFIVADCDILPFSGS